MTAPAEQREPLDVLAEEFLDRYRRGERPALSEFAACHPELAEKIRELFPTLVELEQVGSSSCTPATQPSGFQCPERLGDYRIIREIGRGGMGIVYEAEQESLGRRVALKVFPFHALLDPKHLARFQREARAAAQLHHSHIVPVFGVGQCEGLYYYAMQFIDGQSLDVVLRGVAELAPVAAADTKLQIKSSTACDLALSSSLSGLQRNQYYRRVARLALQAAEGLAYAHAQGIVHRDIKPSNLLLDKAGDIWITDFGLAKHEGPNELTQSGDVIGTLRYMAPEQLQGWADPRTDLHALGLTLYELLALRPANDASSRGELMKQIADRAPTPLSRFDRQVPRDLETIVGKLIAKEPGERYVSASEAASDLARFLADQPIQARRSSAWERLWRTVRRHPTVASLVATVICLLVIIASLLAATSMRVRASLAAVSLAEREKTDQLWKAKLNEALSLRYSGRVGQRTEAWQRLMEAAKLAREVGAGEEARCELRNAAISSLALTDLRYDRPGPVELPGGSILGFDPALTRYLRSDSQGNVSVRRVSDDQEVASLGIDTLASGVGRYIAETEDHALPFSADGKLVALTYYASEFGTQPGHVVVWHLERQQPVFTAPVQAWGHALDMSRDGRQLVVAGRDAVAHVYDVATQQETAAFRLPYASAYLSLSPRANRLAIHSTSEVTVVDVPTGLVMHRLPHDSANHIAWHPAGKLLAVTSNDFLTHVWNMDTGREQCVLRGHQALPYDPAFTPDGEVILTSTYDSTVRLWNAWTGQELVRCPGTIGSFMSADGRRLAVRQEYQYFFYDILRSAEYRTLPVAALTRSDRYQAGVAQQHPRTHWLPVVGWDGVRLVDLDTGRELGQAPIGFTETLCWSPDGSIMYTTGAGGTRRWPVVQEADRCVIGPPEKIGAQGVHVAIHPSGSPLAVGLTQGDPFVLDLTRQPLVPQRINHISASTTNYSADGQWFVAGTHHGAGLKVWRAGQEQHAAFLMPEVDRTDPAFSPDSRILAASDQGLIRLWRVGDWQLLRSIKTVGGHFPSFSFSPDSRLLAYSRTPYEVCLEEIATGRQLAVLAAPDDLEAGPKFDHTGTRLLLVHSYPPALRVWDLRLVRERLASIELADGLPDWPPAAVTSTAVTRVEFDEGPTVKQLELRAEAFRARMQYDLAVADLETILRQEPDNLPALNRLAWFRCIGPSTVRDPARAEPLIRRACELAPQIDFHHGTLGLVHYRLGRYAEALAAIDRSQEVAGGSSDSQVPYWGFVRALAQCQMGRQDEAQKSLDQALQWLTENRTNPHLEALKGEAEVLLSGDNK